MEAIDLCLGARRSLTFCDDDFYQLQLTQPIKITITLGELDSHLRSMEILPIRLPQFRTFFEAISPEPSLALSEALAACFQLGTHDPAIAMGGAIDALIRIPEGPKKEIAGFYEMPAKQQTVALRRLAKAECDALGQVTQAQLHQGPAV